MLSGRKQCQIAGIVLHQGLKYKDETFEKLQTEAVMRQKLSQNVHVSRLPPHFPGRNHSRFQADYSPISPSTKAVMIL